MTSLAFRGIATAVLMAALTIAVPASAGRSCEEATATPVSLQRAIGLARKVVEQLDVNAEQVAIVARVGQDLSKYNLRYSHLGFAVRHHPEGQWAVVHNLNQCGTAQSSLFVQGMANFFADDVFAYESAILVPSPLVQQRLEKTLVSSSQARRLHDSRYNVVAYPFATQYQNSNQWALEVLASALASENDVATRAEAQRWLKSANYEPTQITIPTLTRLGGRMFKANVAFDDHPSEYRWQGKIHVVTVDSVFDFLRKRMAEDSRRITVRLDE
jgi:hypothetical protein